MTFQSSAMAPRLTLVFLLLIALKNLSSSGSAAVFAANNAGGDFNWSDPVGWRPTLVPANSGDQLWEVDLIESGNIFLNFEPTVSDLTMNRDGVQIFSDQLRRLRVVDQFLWLRGQIGDNVDVEPRDAWIGGDVRIAGGRLIGVESITHTNGRIQAMSGTNSVVIVSGSSEYRLLANGTLFNGGGRMVVAPNARLSVGADSANIDWIVDQSGALEVSHGRLELHRGGKFSGVTTIGTGATLLFANGSFEFADARLGGEGALHINTTMTQTSEGHSIVNGGSTLAMFGGAILGGDGVVESSRPVEIFGGRIAGNIELRLNNGGAMIGGVTVNDRPTIEIGGTFVHTNGTWFVSGQGPTIRVRVGGIYDLGREGIVFAGGVDSTLTNSAGGVVRKSTGTGRTRIDWRVDSRGQVDVQTGELSFSKGGSFGGEAVIETGAAFVLEGGDFDIMEGTRARGGGAFAVNGPLIIPAGVQLRADSTDTALFSGGAFGGEGTVEVGNAIKFFGGRINGTVTVNANQGGEMNSSVHMENSVLNVFGEFTHKDGATWFVSSGANPLIRVRSGATYEMRPGGVAFVGAADDTFLVETNALVRKSTGDEFVVIHWGVTNLGRFRVERGGVRFNSTFTQTAGELHFADGTALTHPGDLLLRGGRLSGTGALISDSGGRVLNEGAVVAPGESIGTLSIGRDYVQQSDGILEIELSGGGTLGDQLSVGQRATLAGRLNVQLEDGVAPAATSIFTVLTAAQGVSGRFDNTPNDQLVLAGIGVFEVRYEANAVSLTGFAPATLPIITVQPKSRIVRVGANVTFSVTATSSTALSFQWLKNGVNLVGETNANLVLTNVQTAATGDYRVIVANDAGQITSATASLLVRRGPDVSMERPQPDGGFNLRFQTTPNRLLSVEVSENLRSWSALTNVTADAAGVADLEAAMGTNHRRFFRTVDSD